MKTRTSKAIVSALTFLLLSAGHSAVAQEGGIEIQALTEDLHCLMGSGGNIGVLVGEKGLLLVDTGNADTAEAVASKLQETFSLPVSHVVNTHYHADHTGGNAILGRDAEIICHESCQETYQARHESEQDAASPGTPTRVFDEELALSLEGSAERVTLRHFGAGHSAGDTVVLFPEAKVIHAGDLFFHGVAPYIDVADGADTASWIETIRRLAREHPDYRVIPGHGPVTDMAAWIGFADYLAAIRSQVEASIAAGRTEDETVASVDLSAYPAIQDYADYGLTRENNVRWIYQELTGGGEE
jgi:glyoxylase-like metal-dependent hydrolase (beta-lactamase superfamily II)